jgi:hypothetical protein
MDRINIYFLAGIRNPRIHQKNPNYLSMKKTINKVLSIAGFYLIVCAETKKICAAVEAVISSSRLKGFMK